MSRITRLNVENFCRIKAVRLDLDDAGNLIVIGGRNAQGKTSVLDAIVAGLLGGKRIPADPVRHGEDEAVITIELSDGLWLERRIDPDRGMSLRLRDADGGAVKRPQELLDKLCGSIAFDPLSFARAEPKEQLKTLEGLIGIDGPKLERQRQALEEDRRVIGRERDRLKALYASSKFDPDAKPINTDAVLSELKVAQEAQNRIQVRQAQANRLREDIAQMEEQALRLLAEIAEQSERHAQMVEWLAANPEPDLAPIEGRLRLADAANAKVRQNEESARVAKDMDEATAEYDRLTGEIQAVDAIRKRAIAEAKLPVEGLDFGLDGVLYNDVPFEQASSAEKIRVSLALGMAANPELRNMLMREGAFLDDDGVALVAKLAAEHDFHLFIERPGQEDGAFVVIEDGEVKA